MLQPALPSSSYHILQVMNYRSDVLHMQKKESIVQDFEWAPVCPMLYTSIVDVKEIKAFITFITICSVLPTATSYQSCSFLHPNPYH